MAMQGVAIEFRSVWKDISNWKGADWRRIGRAALPVAGAALCGAGALCVRKQRDPPEANVLATHGTFRCVPRSSLVQESLPTATSIDGALKDAGADLVTLRRTARRLRGPIERDLMVSELQLRQEAGLQRASVYQALVKKWEAAGYFSEPVERTRPRPKFIGVDPVTQVDETYGRDIGCEVPLCLLGEKAAPAKNEETGPQTLSPEDWSAAAASLERHGAVVIRNLLPLQQVGALRQRLHLHSSALDVARSQGKLAPEAVPVREFDDGPLQEEDEQLEPRMSTPGRRHYYIRGRPLEEAVKIAQAGAMPLVCELLDRQRQAAGLPEDCKPYVSEVQLMISDPCAIDQFWHVDNAAPGVTLVVPLTAIPEDMGVTFLLAGSHHLFEEGSRMSCLGACIGSLLSGNSIPAVTMAPGDAFLYDSRLLHRTAANRRYERTSAVLVFRYDYQRPPGMGLVAAQGWSWAGNFLAALHRVYGALPGPVKESASTDSFQAKSALQ